MATIYLIRHGQASFGSENYDKLSALGIQQALTTGEFFQQLNIRFDRVYTGSLERQQDTAKYILQALGSLDDIYLDNAFNEIQAEQIVQHMLPAILQQHPELLDKFTHAKQHINELKPYFDQMLQDWAVQQLQLPNVTAWPDKQGQVLQSFNNIVSRLKNHEQVAIVTSCGPITALTQHLTQMPTNKAFDLAWQIVNCSVTTLQIQNQHPVLDCFNSSTHLHLQNNPELITYR